MLKILENVLFTRTLNILLWRNSSTNTQNIPSIKRETQIKKRSRIKRGRSRGRRLGDEAARMHGGGSETHNTQERKTLIEVKITQYSKS